MQLDILAIGAHPDDVELCCAGTIIKHIQKGYKIGIVDLTRGELGTRGTPELRLQEAANAAVVMGVEIRENLGMADGFFENNRAHQLQLIRVIRKYRPKIVLANATQDRHIDHGRASKLISDACFLAGLTKIETLDKDQVQERWRPKAVYHYIQDRYIEPDFVVDITPYMDQKMEAIMAYRSQFHNATYEGNANELQTPISGKDFLDYLRSRAISMGRSIGAEYAEGYTVERIMGVDDLFDLK